MQCNSPRKPWLLVLALLAGCSGTLFSDSQTATGQARLERRYQEIRNDVTLFHSYRCQYCRKEIAFLESVRSQYPGIRFNYLEIARPENEENRELFSYVMTRLGSNQQGVPRTVVRGKVFIGFLAGDCALSFNEVYRAYNGCETALVAEIDTLAGRSTRQVGAAAAKTQLKFVAYNNLSLFLLVPIYVFSLYFFRDKLNTPQRKRYWRAGLFAMILACIILFLLLTPQSQILRAVQSMPFPAFVLFIALVDGFNPCSFSILIIFLWLLTYTRAKRDMYLVGVTFIVASAVMYAVLIMSMMMLTSLFFARHEDIIGKVLGGIVLVLGAINAKDIVFPGKGPSLSVSPEKKTALVRRFSRIVELLKRSTPLGTYLAVALTIAVSVGVSLLELGCTAILPAVYMTSVLKRFGPSLRSAHVLWTAFYAAVYVIPLIFILANFMLTFRSRRMTERQGRTLKVASGLVMIAFAIVMIAKPELLSFT